MAITHEESSVPQPSVATSCRPVDSSASSKASIAPSMAGTEGLKTIRILKEWPLVADTANKAQQLYKSLKTKSRIFNWSCALAEKSFHAVYQRSTKFLPVLYPAIGLADFVASKVAEAAQQQLPFVRQPTSQVSETVRSRFNRLLAPLSATIGFVFRIKRRARNATKQVVQTYKKLLITVDKWMDEIEKYIAIYKSKGMQASQVQKPAPLPQTLQAVPRSLKGRALNVAATAALVYVGACFWLLSRLPVVGAYLQHIPSPASSKSSSPQREPEPQSSQSSTESRAEAQTAELTQEERVKRLLRVRHSSRENQFEK